MEPGHQLRQPSLEQLLMARQQFLVGLAPAKQGKGKIRVVAQSPLTEMG